MLAILVVICDRVVVRDNVVGSTAVVTLLECKLVVESSIVDSLVVSLL